MASIVEIKLELGHRAKVRDVPSLEGHTHDWVLFVKGSEGIKLEYFVEKVVFWLHSSYEPPRRVIKSPPYRVEQSGFAGFNMLIYIHFRNKEDPKMVRFEYDLFLHTESMPPVNHTRLEKLTFTNPTKDFREKLLKAGAMLIEANTQPTESALKDSNRPHSGQKSSHREKSKMKEDKSHDSKRYAARKQGPNVKRSVDRDEKPSVSRSDDVKHEEHPKQHKKSSAHASPYSHNSSESGTMKTERDRSVKDRTLNPEKSEKKKKRSSEESASKPASGDASRNLSKKKEKKKIKMEKPDAMSGLFAPENSININQIKHSKGKKKDHSHHEPKRKPEKDGNTAKHAKSTAKEDSKPAACSVTPTKKAHKSGVDNIAESPSRSNVKPGTIKVKKEPKTSHIGGDASTSAKHEKKRHLPVSSESSSSNSDMDISDSDIYRSSSEKKSKPDKRKVSRSETKQSLQEEIPKGFADDKPHKNARQKQGPNSNMRSHHKKRESSKDRSGNSKKTPRSSHGKVDEKSIERSEKHRKDSPADIVRHKKMKETSPSNDSARQSAGVPTAPRVHKDKGKKSSSKSRSPEGSASAKKNMTADKKRPDQTGSSTRVSISDEVPYLPTFDGERSPKISKSKPSQANSKPKKVFKSSSFVESSSGDDSEESEPAKSELTKLREENQYSLSPAQNSSAPSDGEGSITAEPIASEPLPGGVGSSDESAEELNPVVPSPALRDMQTFDSSSNDHGADYPPPLGQVRTDQLELFQDFDMGSNGNTSSSEDDPYLPEDLFQNSREVKDETTYGSQGEQSADSPDVKVRVSSEKKTYPHLTDALHLKLQELQRKLAIVNNADRLRKIVSIVAKSQTYVMNSGYFDFDLCSLDARTIQKIEKHLVAD